jgi:hypothetical protein
VWKNFRKQKLAADSHQVRLSTENFASDDFNFAFPLEFTLENVRTVVGSVGKHLLTAEHCESTSEFILVSLPSSKTVALS